jgi:tRNA modification GTPase
MNKEIYITSERQHQKLVTSKKKLLKLIDGLNAGLGYEFLTFDLREALNQLSEIIGDISTEDILNNVFKNFCIGK